MGRSAVIVGITGCLFLVLCTSIVCGANESNISGFIFKVQEDPYFTFGYPDGMTLDITSETGRNTYILSTEKTPSVKFFVTSMENPDWAVLSEESSGSIEESLRNKFISSSSNLTPGEKAYNLNNNLSSYLVSYLDPDQKELIYSLVMSNDEDIIYGMISEPAGLYKTEFGDFVLKSLMSLTPRTPENGLTFIKAETSEELTEKLANTTKGSVTKDFVYDPYSGLYMDTETGYYYIPNLGVFYDPMTGYFYYPSEFGTYDENFFEDYSGLYTSDGYSTDGYYDSLYTGYDASDIISDAYENRQNVYDAANAMWDDYILGNDYYAVDDSGYSEPIDTIQEYQDYDLS